MHFLILFWWHFSLFWPSFMFSHVFAHNVIMMSLCLSPQHFLRALSFCLCALMCLCQTGLCWSRAVQWWESCQGRSDNTLSGSLLLHDQMQKQSDKLTPGSVCILLIQVLTCHTPAQMPSEHKAYMTANDLRQLPQDISVWILRLSTHLLQISAFRNQL